LENSQTLSDERAYHLYDTKTIEDEKHFLLKCHVYTQIRSQFQNICHNTDLPNLPSHQNYGDLGTFLLMFFEHGNKIIKKNPSNPLPFLRFDRPIMVSMDINHRRRRIFLF
jgi:hypothetical protein